MEKRTIEYTTIDLVSVNKTKEVFICTDGTKFESYEETRAINHQNYLDKIKSLKTAINYMDIDVAEYDCVKYYERKSFLFDVTRDNANRLTDLIYLQSLRRDNNILKSLSDGRYIVIEFGQTEYNSNGPDDYLCDGYFGLLDDYLLYLNDRIGQINELKTQLNLHYGKNK